MANIHIKYSALVPKRKFERILARHYNSEVMQNRTMFSLKMEWACHNFLYKIGYKPERTRDVDLDYPCDRPEWIYIVCGILCWIFID